MYIQRYFKSGKKMKTINKIKSIKYIVNLFKEMNGGKVFPEWEAEGWKRNDIVFNNGNKRNMWDVLVSNGFSTK